MKTGNFAIDYQQHVAVQRQEARAKETCQRMKVEGSHLLCGVTYWPSERGSRILAPIIARVKARDAA